MGNHYYDYFAANSAFYVSKGNQLGPLTFFFFFASGQFFHENYPVTLWG